MKTLEISHKHRQQLRDNAIWVREFDAREFKTGQVIAIVDQHHKRLLTARKLVKRELFRDLEPRVQRDPNAIFALLTLQPT